MARDPSSRPRRGDPEYEQAPGNPVGCTLAAVGVCVFVVLACASFGVFLILPALGGAGQRPGFGPGPHRPPIGPARPPHVR
ncbi:MAG TPA: hypothetical protein VKA46_42405 [Gemmataceae bacterium]|nr:hypothetical protein [Gemmataceae bacterium]